ncbi:MAG TPA: hypothetical protein VE465_03175 [Streptosporangiaceae bacterium]|nr:hypothetical protein [Streptosporangiaceae bacterium]
MSKIADLLNNGRSQRAAQAAAGAPPARPPSGAQPAAAPAPPAAPGGGGGHEMQVQRQALERAAGAAPDLEATIRAGLRAIGPESREAAAGLKGWATAGALDKVAHGWHIKINSIADHVADFEPKLRETARHVERAEQDTTQLIQRLRAW